MINPENIIFGIDIGTTNLKIVAVELQDIHHFEVIDYYQFHLPKRRHKSLPYNLIADHLTKAFQKTQYEIGQELSQKRAIITLPKGYYTSYRENVSITVEGHPISHEDKYGLINKAKKRCKGQVILHTIPIEYMIDGQTVKDPVGKRGREITLEILLICYDEIAYEQFRQVMKQMNVTVGKYVAPSLSFVNLFLNHSQGHRHPNNIFVVDCGGQVTTAFAVKNGQLTHEISIDLGSENISRDISAVLRVNGDMARKLKEEYSVITHTQVEQVKKINGIDIDIRTVNQVVEARYDEIIELIQNNNSMPVIIDDCQLFTLVGDGHPVESEKVLKDRFQLKYYGSKNYINQRSYVYALGNIHYCLNNEIFLPRIQAQKKMGIWRRLRSIVEDLM